MAQKCILLTELAYDGHSCAHHAIPLLQAVGPHGNERVGNGGGEQHCIDGDDLKRGLQETDDSRQTRSRKITVVLIFKGLKKKIYLHVLYIC